MRYLGVLFEHTISIFVPAIVQALDYLLPVSNEKCKAEHFYDQVNSLITTIKSKIKEEKDWEEIDMENIFKLPDEKYLRMLFKQTMKTAEILVANWEEGLLDLKRGRVANYHCMDSKWSCTLALLTRKSFNSLK